MDVRSFQTYKIRQSNTQDQLVPVSICGRRRAAPESVQIYPSNAPQEQIIYRVLAWRTSLELSEDTEITFERY
jgi:hypothetical protein